MFRSTKKLKSIYVDITLDKAEIGNMVAIETVD